MEGIEDRAQRSNLAVTDYEIGNAPSPSPIGQPAMVLDAIAADLKFNHPDSPDVPSTGGYRTPR